jgi:hypothetical protein
MKFEELDAEVQDKVRKWQIDDDWWDFIYEDAVRMGAILGIMIYDRVTKSVRGKPFSQPDIYFDLGRGGEVTFCGRLDYRIQALDEIKRETNDEVLISLAQRLDGIFVTMRMKDMPRPAVQIAHLSITVDWDDEYEGDIDLVEKDLMRIIHDFRIWVWNNLDHEYDYLSSDECLSERDYAEDGTTI